MPEPLQENCCPWRARKKMIDKWLDKKALDIEVKKVKNKKGKEE